MEPQTPAILFAIDVSYPMMKEGIVQMICSNMKEMLKNLPRDMYCDKVRFFANVFLFSFQSVSIEYDCKYLLSYCYVQLGFCQKNKLKQMVI